MDTVYCLFHWILILHWLLLIHWIWSTEIGTLEYYHHYYCLVFGPGSGLNGGQRLSKTVIYGYYYISKVDRVSTDSKNAIARLAAREILHGTKCYAWNLAGATVSVVSTFESLVLYPDPGRSYYISTVSFSYWLNCLFEHMNCYWFHLLFLTFSTLRFWDIWLISCQFDYMCSWNLNRLLTHLIICLLS